MAHILLSRTFELEGQRVMLTAGVRDGRPMVVFGLPDAGGLNQLANITIEYPMVSAASAVRFVEKATEAEAARGLTKYRNEVQEVADRVNRALNMPVERNLGYKRRGK
ncbi:TPA: hypothetical protein I9Y37_001941 [Citrobacter freundii]|nr:hypothetical protein [Citrobacter freundii]HAT3963916.1 hypothetical protein [Citrobacter freundii]